MVDAHAQESLDIAVIGGDGIGPEVVAEGLKVLSAITSAAPSNGHKVHGLTVNITEYDLGARRWLATGETLPDSVLTEIRRQRRAGWRRVDESRSGPSQAA